MYIQMINVERQGQTIMCSVIYKEYLNIAQNQKIYERSGNGCPKPRTE